MTQPPQWPHRHPPTAPPPTAQPPTAQPPQPPRPPDVDTGFWLWLIAVPLLVAGYVVDIIVSPTTTSVVVGAASALFVTVLAAIVTTFLFLLRAGYRWARTLLTGGGVASIVYVVTSLFGVERPELAAVVFAVTGIVGSVAIAGGVVLLHRKDAHAYFTR